MKTYYFFSLLLFFSIDLSAQSLYVISEDYGLYVVNTNTCDLDFITNFDVLMTDISFHPNGNLYGIRFTGELVEIDTLTGNVTVIHNFPYESGMTISYNSMTISSEGLIYLAVSTADMYTFDLATNNEVYLGNVGYDASGDLTFYQGDLYLAASDGRVVLIDTESLSNSTLIMNDPMIENFYGFTTYHENCNETTYLISYNFFNNSSSLFQLDWNTNALNTLCDFDIGFYGSASPTEFLSSSPSIIVQDIITNLATCNENNGSIIITAYGDSDELSYSIDGVNYQPTGVFENLSGGNYIISVMTPNGCENFQEVELELPILPEFVNIITENNGCDNDNGSMFIIADGGMGDLTYSIDGVNFQFNNIFENLTVGTYTVTISDADGCTNAQQVQLAPPDLPELESITTENASCEDGNGSISISANGGVGDLSYSIDGVNFQSNSVFENLTAGIYTITVTDLNGCTTSQEIQLAPSDPPEFESIIIENASCSDDNASISILVEGGVGDLSYSIDGDNFQSDGVFENLSSGIYPVLVMDENGCTTTSEASIVDLPELFLDRIESLPASCGERNGGGQFYFTGEDDSLQIMIDGDNYYSQTNINDLACGIYNVQIISKYNCLIDTVLNVGQKECPLYIPNAFSPNADGQNDNFKIYPHPSFKGEFLDFKIFDRWGELVYEIKNFEANELSWNGTFKGEYLGVGVFVYYLKYQPENAEIKLEKGDVTIIK